LGLSDGYGTIDTVARDVFDAEDIRDFSVKPNFAEKLAKQFGADMAEGVANALSRVSVR
jgi:protease-4